MGEHVLYYTVARCIPDPVRDEAINFGVIVVSRHLRRAESRWLPVDELQRRLEVTGDHHLIDGARRFINRMAGCDEQVVMHVLSGLAVQWGGVFRLTRVRPCTGDMANVVEELYDEFVAPRLRWRRGDG